tara:strand:+ start:57609 stop:58445 length:837 start_codon:yes stop_codon:yes gene_type:complete
MEHIQICDNCHWEFTTIENIKIMISTHDKNSSLFSSYSKNYDQIAQNDLNTSFLDDRYVEIQAEQICKLCPSLKGKDVCDLGSGRGFLVNKIQKRNPKSITAVDISLPYLKNFSSKIEVYQANAENLPFKDKFDIITCTDIMEHVINIGSFLFSLNRSLRTKGYTVIRVPYKENLLNYAPQNGCEYEFAHLRDFNHENIKRLLKFAGMKVISFHINSFSLQTPQEFWMKTQRRKNWYNSLQSFARKYLKQDSDINLYPSSILRLFMKPLEITVLAQKI